MPKKTRGALTVRNDSTGAAPLPVLGKNAVAKLPGVGGTVRREKGATLIEGRPYMTRDGEIPAWQVFYVDDVRPDRDGPWLGEADKVAWRDQDTGYECIILRDARGGHLCGYVGVPQGHPLWGFSDDAIPADLGIEVHGGLSYSNICDEGPTPERFLSNEARSICHVVVPKTVRATTEHATEYRVNDAHAWWFGFECNQVYDLVPNTVRPDVSVPNAEIGRIYRDDAYLLAEVRALAAQLRAVADGLPAPTRDGPPPPVGLSPRQGC